MSNSPLVTVMIPCYNSSSTLARAISSLIAQSHENWEAILIDDGSVDHPEKVLEQFADPRIRAYRNSENQGRGACRQLALEKMRGQYLTMLDSDDWILPDKFAKQLEILNRNPQIALVSSAMYLMLSDGSLAGVARFGISEDIQVLPALEGPGTLPIAHAPIMVRQQVLQGRSYDVSLKFSEDLDFFLPILLQHSFAVTKEPLYVYSFEDNQTLTKWRSQLRSQRQIFAKYKSQYFVEVQMKSVVSWMKELFAPILISLKKGRTLAQASEAEALEFKRGSAIVSERSKKRFRAPTGA